MIKATDLVMSVLKKTGPDLHHSNRVDRTRTHLVNSMTDQTWCSQGSYDWQATIEAKEQEWMTLSIRTQKELEGYFTGYQTNMCSGCARHLDKVLTAAKTLDTYGLISVMPGHGVQMELKL